MVITCFFEVSCSHGKGKSFDFPLLQETDNGWHVNGLRKDPSIHFWRLVKQLIRLRARTRTLDFLVGICGLINMLELIVRNFVCIWL